VALAAASLCGCVDLPKGPFTPPPPDVTSPIAGDILKLDLKTAGYPSFVNVPQRPLDVRPTSAWTRNIYNTLRARRQMQALQELYPQTLYGGGAFEQENRALAAPPLSPEEAAARAEQTAAFSKSGRERATPPSPAP
jgi:hypothetical protein